ncbi:hypothetical protein ACET3Z_006113 [Daucus carota]
MRHNDKVEKWREALVEVGNILGEHVNGQQSTFVQNTVKLFKETLAAKCPECRLPVPERSVLRGSANGLAKKVLLIGNVVFEERNCSKEAIYLKELEELVGKEKVRFPMVIVNGKICVEKKEVEGLDDFEDKQKLMLVLNVTERAVKSFHLAEGVQLMGKVFKTSLALKVFLSSEAPGPDGAVNVGYGQTPETVVPESTPVNLVPKDLNVPGGLTEEIKTSQKAIAPDASMIQHLWLRIVQAGALRGEHLLLHILQGSWLILIRIHPKSDLNLKTSHHKEHSI